MSEPQGEYRIQPLRRMAKVYQFPTLSRFEIDELTYEQRKLAMRDQQVLAALREKARLQANIPLPWHKRIAKWYDRNYMKLFDGVGASIAFLAGLAILLTVFVNLGRSFGWWSI